MIAIIDDTILSSRRIEKTMIEGFHITVQGLAGAHLQKISKKLRIIKDKTEALVSWGRYGQEWCPVVGHWMEEDKYE